MTGASATVAACGSWLGEPEYRNGVAHLRVALQPVHPGQGLFNALRFAHPHERLQHV